MNRPKPSPLPASLAAWFNLAGYLAMLSVNILANALPINGKTTGELSDQYPNLFVPAGYTFSIWGAIYLLLGLYVVSEFLPRKENHENVIDPSSGSVLFILTCLANAGWIVAWHYQALAVSLLLMILLLSCLIILYLRHEKASPSLSPRYLWMVRLPFRVYLGWISVATIANVTAVLVSIGWNGLGLPETFWTMAMILVAVGLAVSLRMRFGDAAFLLTVGWALAGILVKRLNDPSAPSRLVALVAGTGVTLLGLVLLLSYFRRPAR